MNALSHRHSPIIAVATLCAPVAVAQTALYSNGSADPAVAALATGATTGSGAAAPAGTLWSEAASDALAANAVGGFSAHLTGASGAYRFADDFTVTSPAGWRIDRIALFAYQTGAAQSVSPFTGLNVRIWRGRPRDAGSTVIWGDTTTNRLASSTSAAIYRVFNTTVAPAAAATTDKLIWRSEADIGGLMLAPGTYWIDWQYSAAVVDGEAFCPPVTIAGVRSQPGFNAQQFKTTGSIGTWADVLDLGKPSSAADVPQDLPFIILGAAVCTADFNSDGSVDINDFFGFLTAYAGGDGRADIDGVPGIDINDFFAFLTAYSAGCP